MDTRRKELGECVRAAREAQGYPSMQAFANAIDISVRSVAKIENGKDDAGPKVMRAVARGLGWPSNSLSQYLRMGDATVLAPSEALEPRPVPEPVDLVDLHHQATAKIQEAMEFMLKWDEERKRQEGRGA